MKTSYSHFSVLCGFEFLSALYI